MNKKYFALCMLGALAFSTHAETAPYYVTVSNYIEQLKCDLAPLDSVVTRQSIIKEVRNTLDSSRGVTPEQANEITRSAIIKIGEAEQRAYAEAYYDNPDRISRVVTSQTGNLLAVLKKSSHIDGRALAPYFGDKLLEKTEKDALHPDNIPHLKREWRILLYDQNHIRSSFIRALENENLPLSMRQEIAGRIIPRCKNCCTDEEARECMKQVAYQVFNEIVYRALNAR